MRFALAMIVLGGCVGHLGNPLDSEDTVDAPDELRPIGPAHGVENELVEYEVKLRGFTVGRLQVAVGSRGVVNGRPAVVVRSRAVGAGMVDVLGQFHWELTTTVDIDAGCVLDEEEEIAISVAGKREHDRETRKFTLEQCRHNMHSSAGALRGWRSRVGAQTSLAVAFDHQVIDVALSDAARETIGTAIGSTPAVRYDGTLRNKHPFSAWLSDDDARVPLRLRSGSKLGQVEIEMVRYDVPK